MIPLSAPPQERWIEATNHPASEAGYSVPSVHASISDSYANAVRAGYVEPVCGYVHSGTGNTLHIAPSKPPHSEPSEAIEHVDDVILCTGFTPALEYLEPTLRDTIGLDATGAGSSTGARDDALQPLLLHRDVMHPDLPGLYFVGMYRGPYFAAVELQAVSTVRTVHVFALLRCSFEC